MSPAPGGRARLSSYVLFQFLPFVGLTGLALVCAALSAARAHVEPLLVSLACLATAVLLVPPLLRGERNYDLMEPINFVVPTAFLGTTVKTLFIVLYPSDRTTDFLMVGEPNRILFPALGWLCAGLTALALGYSLNVPLLPVRKLAAELAARPWDPTRLRWLMLASGLLALGCAWQFTHLLGPDALDHFSRKRFHHPRVWDGLILLGVAQLTYTVYLVFAQLLTTRGRLWPEWLFLGASLVLLATFYTFISTRTLLVNVVVYLMLLGHYLRGPIRPVQAVGGFVAVLALVALIGGLRPSPENRSPTLREGAHAAWSGFLDLAVNNRNYLGAPETAIILNAVPARLGFQYGETMITWLYVPVPRALWPGKPQRIRVGYMLSPLFKRKTKFTGATPGIVAELYLNFGWWGILPGMFCLGVVLRVLYVSFRPFLTAKGVLPLYLLPAFSLGNTLVSADVSGAVILLLQGTFILLVYIVLISSPPADPD